MKKIVQDVLWHMTGTLAVMGIGWLLINAVAVISGLNV